MGGVGEVGEGGRKRSGGGRTGKQMEARNGQQLEAAPQASARGLVERLLKPGRRRRGRVWRVGKGRGCWKGLQARVTDAMERTPRASRLVGKGKGRRIERKCHFCDQGWTMWVGGYSLALERQESRPASVFLQLLSASCVPCSWWPTTRGFRGSAQVWAVDVNIQQNSDHSYSATTTTAQIQVCPPAEIGIPVAAMKYRVCCKGVLWLWTAQARSKSDPHQPPLLALPFSAPSQPCSAAQLVPQTPSVQAADPATDPRINPPAPRLCR